MKYYLILHGLRVGNVRDRNTAFFKLAVPLVSFLTEILCVHTVYIYIIFDFAQKYGRQCAASEHCIISSTSRITPLEPTFYANASTVVHYHNE
jgi:hypothetical protein